jgi:RNA polymerase sigma-70 factor (ECF subfamily)
LSDCLDEQRLIRELVARDCDAWQHFVERFQGLVYARTSRTALECNLRLDRADIDDLCAEVFACLVADDFATLRRFEGRSKLATWLSVIARRTTLRRLSQRRDINSFSGNDPDRIDENTNQNLDALSRMIDEENAERLHTMMTRLGDGDQWILRMFYLDGLSYREISERMDLAVNTIGPKLQRAQKRLKKLLTTEEAERATSQAKIKSKRKR